ncbi:DUF4190 domain-containing protein [Actinoplanes sp. KI2]|uniref:DUF4190 domain-containing protein n=1 Tax=Actinoplanes sp. KI2 TaxID=2983315 RepID=UPI0021D5B346|nr:DUF4190 domain-containing protein [Actinoplanes sp. KI2]MCU7723955.1 DUF4190 domain-containing protein [Actinoplanes sp. KI2]
MSDENSSSASAPPPDPTAPPVPTAPAIPAVPPDPVPPAYQPPSGYPAPDYPAGYQAAGYQPPPGYYPGPGYPPPYGYPGFPPPPPADPGTNGFAIAALVTSFLGGSLLSVAFGIVALVQIRTSRQRGRGLAIAGLAVSACWVLLVCGLLGYGFVQGARESANDNSSSVGGGPAATVTTDYKVGECLTDLYGPTPKPVSCTTAHPGEIYAVVNLPDGPWPGVESVKKQAEQECEPLLGRYLTDHPNLDFTYLYPGLSGWPADRRVICIALDPEGDLRAPLVK